MRKNKRIIKMIKESETLTKQEKRELIIKGRIENIVNSYKVIIKLPFFILGILFVTLECLFGYITEFFSLIEQVFSSICIKIDNFKEFNITNGKAREKILKEIKEKKVYKVY